MLEKGEFSVKHSALYVKKIMRKKRKSDRIKRTKRRIKKQWKKKKARKSVELNM